MATLDADKPSTTESDAPLDIDLYCLNCGYNLRGLPGDPIRCPECGGVASRVSLAQWFDKRVKTRARLLSVAAGACPLFVSGSVGMGLLAAAYGATPGVMMFLPICLSGFAIDVVWFRSICRGEPGWVGALAIGNVFWTLGLLLLALVVGLSALLWGWLEAGNLRDGLSPILIVFPIVALLLAATIAALSPLHKRARARLELLARRSEIRRLGWSEAPDDSLEHAVERILAIMSPMKHESLVNILTERFAVAVGTVAEAPADEIDPQVRAAQDPRFGDYQCNVAMSLAKSLKAKPREIAGRIIAELDVSDICEPPEIAGPGFINIRLTNEALSQYLGEIPAPPPESEPGARATGQGQAKPPESTDAARAEARGSSAPAADRLGMPPVEKPQKVVVDYSSPNIAKQMHVGHLRSTIIGDVFARVLGLEGHEVIRQNHVGDWGTQFGILIETYKQKPIPTTETHDDVLQAIEDDYRAAQQRFKSDEVFADAARQSVGALQSGNPEARRVWERICAQSRHAFTDAYQRLNVLLQDEDVRGESFYNERLAPVVDEVRKKLTRGERARPTGPHAEYREDQGAKCIFFYDDQGAPRFKKPDGDELPMIVQKSDGAYLYATTDLAALRYRIQELGATRLIYVTDARQKLHFQMLFAAARAIGWAGDDVQLEHATFGSVLGANRRPLKTREGENVKLSELLDEAEKRAWNLLEERHEATKPRSHEGEERAHVGFSDAEKREIARRVGIGAVKYADLRNDRVSDYVFNWDKMLALQGNTAPYMMYAYARIRSIYRKAAERFGSPDVYGPGVTLALDEPAERALALRLARLRETIDAVAAELAPHILCSYLYELAAEFMRFYEACPVIQAPDEATRLSRMRLCDLTARALRLGLGLLGIEAVERM